MFHTHLSHSAATRRRCPPNSSVKALHCFAWTEVLKLEPLVNFDLGLCRSPMGLVKRWVHSSASSLDFTG